MSFPAQLKNTFLALEIVFIAENEPVEVVLQVTTSEPLTLCTTELPRLRQLGTYTIPIWLAIILRKQNKITVVPPPWLTEKYLAAKCAEETANVESFAKLPLRWLEISKIFLANFSQDMVVDDSGVVLKLVQDLKETRLVKLRRGLENLNEINLSLNELSLMEINEVRPFIAKVMGNLRKLHKAAEPEGDDNEESEGEGYENDGRNRVGDMYDDDLDFGTDAGGGASSGAHDDDDDDDEMDDIVNEFEM